MLVITTAVHKPHTGERSALPSMHAHAHSHSLLRYWLWRERNKTKPKWHQKKKDLLYTWIQIMRNNTFLCHCNFIHTSFRSRTKASNYNFFFYRSTTDSTPAGIICLLLQIQILVHVLGVFDHHRHHTAQRNHVTGRSDSLFLCLMNGSCGWVVETSLQAVFWVITYLLFCSAYVVCSLSHWERIWRGYFVKES
jgi:Na+/melibiose symporter-like transporter